MTYRSLPRTSARASRECARPGTARARDHHRHQVTGTLLVRARCRVWTLAVMLAAAVGPVADAQQILSSQAEALTLRPGDAVKLTFWRVPELNGEFTVAPDGTLAHPAFSGLVVAGVPLRRVQLMLDSAARKEDVGARVVMQPLLRVMIDGEVRTPNLYRVPPGTSVAEALVLAGGRTEKADLAHLTLIRNGQATNFDLTDPTGSASSIAIASGDRLLLWRSRSSFRETILPYTALIGTFASIGTFIWRVR